MKLDRATLVEMIEDEILDEGWRDMASAVKVAAKKFFSSVSCQMSQDCRDKEEARKEQIKVMRWLDSLPEKEQELVLRNLWAEIAARGHRNNMSPKQMKRLQQQLQQIKPKETPAHLKHVLGNLEEQELEEIIREEVEKELSRS
jgi:hypothetical protein